MEQKKTINIMTSCDQNLAKQIPVLLESIADSLFDRDVHFYLFHSSVEKNTIVLLEKCSKCYNNVCFHEVVVPNPEDYVKLAGSGGGWSGEAYYSLCAHELLPDVDRIMYVDAGDVIITGNIDEYYFGDFEDKSLIVTSARYKVHQDDYFLYEAEDMAYPELLKGILRGLFNSGSYVMNLEKIRQDGYTLYDYLYLSSRLVEAAEIDGKAYWGDQGLLSAAFAGDMKVFGFPEIANVWYMPYNFCLWYYDSVQQKPPYDIRVIHYAGAYKPWKVKYDAFLESFQNASDLNSMDGLKSGQVEYYHMWYEYAVKAEKILKNI